MEVMLTLVSGILFACGVFCLLDGHFIKVVFGSIILSNAVNLLFFAMGRVDRDTPAFIGRGEVLQAANPLSSAAVLTSIVIGFSLTAFIIALMFRAHEQLSSLEVNEVVKEESK
ncbi:MAG: cation:proton antiporter [Halobacteriovoraceae bacterium]|nr:cation:proton antiporter [Halobacteriovoraceae bacterium]|tara:strand:- start:68318 stop:68659 length:342 start_codon:yes stop_codon:yes gene_type:complete